MFDYSAAREQMIDSQIRTADVTDASVIKAFRSVKREDFVPKSKSALAYSDCNIEMEDGRVIMRPRDMSKLIQAAEIKDTDIALDIGCGRGYSTAILSRLAETVIALEDQEERVEKATNSLSEAGSDNAVVVKGDLKAGAKEHGPFDVIFVNGAVGEIPKNWLDQLANEGRLVAVLAEGPIGRASVFTRTGDVIGERVIFDANVPLMPDMSKPAEFAF